MSLIERAVDKLGPQRPERVEASPLPEQEAAAKNAPSIAESLVSRAVAAGARYTPEPAEAPAKQAAVAAPSVVAVPSPPAARPTPTVVPANKAPVVAPNAAPITKAAPVRIPIEMLRARGFVTPDAAPTAISQEFRVIKRPLLANAFGRGTAAVTNGRRVMVTSAFAGEGKSFCAINLAMSIAAERDTYVLLVD
ncbi:MAG: hypothetical protein NTV17_04995, partial [Burkholderiales bacterium]|nr:hypothetical protein [Burkholderiales bacterium]